MAVTPEEQKNARRKAMLLLEHMDRTEKGLSDRLRQAGRLFSRSHRGCHELCAFLWVSERLPLCHELYFLPHGNQEPSEDSPGAFRKGIDRETALAAWEEAAEIEEPDELAILRTTVEKKCQPGTALDEKGMRRLQGFLPSKRFFLWRYFPRAGRHEYYL